MLPDAKLGELASYRTLLVKNRHLATVAEKLELYKYKLTGESLQSQSVNQTELFDQSQPSDEDSTAISMDTEAHINANHLEAILGAVYLDGGLGAAQRLIAQLFFPEEV